MIWHIEETCLCSARFVIQGEIWGEVHGAVLEFRESHSHCRTLDSWMGPDQMKPVDASDLVRESIAVNPGCCGDDKWRGRYCQYHQGYEDGADAAFAAGETREL